MDKMLKVLRRFTATLAPRPPADPLDRMSIRELADIPPYHPPRDTGVASCAETRCTA
jgi:hypothetical protein